MAAGRCHSLREAIGKMELHDLKTAPGARKKRKRVGRGPGSGTGKTSGRGHKGQKSRAGYSRHYGFEGGQMPLHRRLPKRGFNHANRWPMAIVNIDGLERSFEDGATVNAEDVIKAGLARELPGGVKLLARGELTKKLTVQVQAASASATAKIEAAGGSVEIVGRASEKPESPAPVEEVIPAQESSPAEKPAPAADEAPAESSETEEVSAEATPDEQAAVPEGDEANAEKAKEEE